MRFIQLVSNFLFLGMAGVGMAVTTMVILVVIGALKARFRGARPLVLAATHITNIALSVLACVLFVPTMLHALFLDRESAIPIAVFLVTFVSSMILMRVLYLKVMPWLFNRLLKSWPFGGVRDARSSTQA